MNKLMMTVAATMAFAAFAQEPAQPAPAGKAPAAQLARRPMRAPMMMGQGAMDPLMRAVMNPAVAEKIGLSEEQKAKLAELKGGQKVNQELQTKVRAGMERQVELLKAEKIDEAAVMKAIDEVFEARKEMAKAQTRRTIAVRSILTPEQVSKALEAIKVKRDKDAKEGRGFRGMRRNGPKGRGPAEAAPEGDKPAAPAEK